MRRRICLLSFLLGAFFAISPLSAQTVDDALHAFETHDYERAHELLLPFSAEGHPDALMRLGSIYFYGLGVEYDATRAFELFHQAA